MVDRPAGSVGDPLRDFCLLGGLYMGPVRGWIPWIFQTQAQEDRPWNLILVNKDNPIPKNYSVNLLELSNGEKVDERIYPKLQEMFDAARADGIYPVVVAGYRTHEVQQRLLDEKIQAYKDEGYSRMRQKKLAESWVAVPGTSEHELGSLWILMRIPLCAPVMPFTPGWLTMPINTALFTVIPRIRPILPESLMSPGITGM